MRQFLKEADPAARNDTSSALWVLAALLANVVVPGLGYRLARNELSWVRRTGSAWLLRVSLVLWTTALIGIGVSLSRPGYAVSLLLSPSVVILSVLLVCWAFGAVLSTFRLACLLADERAEARSGPWGRRVLPVLAFALAALLAVFPAALATAVAKPYDLVSSVFSSDLPLVAQDGRYNILVAGIDDAPGREENRPDSMSVVSIDARSGSTVIIGISRTTQNFGYPVGSVLAEESPEGSYCESQCGIHRAYTFGNEYPERYPDAAHPGMAALSEAVAGFTGLTMSGSVLVRLSGFAELIDALGGIELTLNHEVPRTGVPNTPGDPPTVVGPPIEAGRQHLTGEDALWVARSRFDSSDDDRMRRQWCVQQATINSLNATTLLTSYEGLASAIRSAVSTDISASGAAVIAESLLNARGSSLRRVDLTPPYVNPYNPNLAFVQTLLQASFAGSELPLPSLDEYLAEHPKEFTQGSLEPEPGLDPAPADPEQVEPEASTPGSTTRTHGSVSLAALPVVKTEQPEMPPCTVP